jgi:hypothetical protein
MGLDIYVRFGEVDEDGEHNWYPKDSKYHDLYEDQMTGFTSCPHAGYLRESWGSLDWVYNAAKEFNAPNPYKFFDEWEGSNGEVYDCSGDGLTKLLSFRDDVIRPWLRENRYPEREWTDDKKNNFDHFRNRLHDVWSFINFVELHKDQENLIIIFG